MLELVINTESFQGTLDILLKLVKTKNIPVLSLNLPIIINQYCNFIMEKQDYEIDQISEYLPVAALLLELQAKVLLPTLKEQTENESEKAKIKEEKLISRIIEYKKIQKITNYFQTQAKQRQLLYSKQVDDSKYYLEAPKIILEKSSIEQLNSAMLKLLKTVKIDNNVANLTLNLISANDRAQEIVQFLKSESDKSFSLTTLFAAKPLTLHYFVITFIAILDLVKNQIISVMQPNSFGMIMIKYKTKGFSTNE